MKRETPDPQGKFSKMIENSLVDSKHGIKINKTEKLGCTDFEQPVFRLNLAVNIALLK